MPSLLPIRNCFQGLSYVKICFSQTTGSKWHCFMTMTPVYNYQLMLKPWHILMHAYRLSESFCVLINQIHSQVFGQPRAIIENASPRCHTVEPKLWPCDWKANFFLKRDKKKKKKKWGPWPEQFWWWFNQGWVVAK